jgi:hypothetical protein
MEQQLFIACSDTTWVVVTVDAGAKMEDAARKKAKKVIAKLQGVKAADVDIDTFGPVEVDKPFESDGFDN